MASRNRNEESQNTQNSNSKASYLEAATRLSTAFPLGAPRKDDDLCRVVDVKGNVKTVGHSETVPGIAVIDYIPTLGVSTNANSPLNRAAFIEFNAIRSRISGNRPYEPVDHMIYRLCVASLRELYMYIYRIYCVLKTYTATNLYRPRAILTAMGLDFDAWNREAANLYAWLCNHANSMEPYPTVPLGNITERHELFNSAFFTDGDSPTAQTYIFNQIAFYSYENVDEVKGISLRYLGSTPENAYILWDELYSALQSSSDVYIIAADIRRAFEDRVITALPAVDVNGAVEYVKFDPVLTTIMNLETVAFRNSPQGGYDTYDQSILDAFRISDGGNGIMVCKPSYDYNIVSSTVEFPTVVAGAAYTNHLNFIDQQPDSSSVVSAMRMHPNIKVTTTRAVQNADDARYNWHVEVEDMGTEVAFMVRYYALNADGNMIFVTTSGGTAMYYVGANRGGQEGLALASISSNFDWHPPHYAIQLDTAFSTGEVTACLEDIQNYVPVSKDVIKIILDSMLLNEFGVL